MQRAHLVSQEPVVELTLAVGVAPWGIGGVLVSGYTADYQPARRLVPAPALAADSSLQLLCSSGDCFALLTWDTACISRGRYTQHTAVMLVQPLFIRLDMLLSLQMLKLSHSFKNSLEKQLQQMKLPWNPNRHQLLDLSLPS